MANDLKLLWHPGFGAVICMEADDEDGIADVLSACPFTEGLTAGDVRFVKRRRFWRMGFWRVGIKKLVRWIRGRMN